MERAGRTGAGLQNRFDRDGWTRQDPLRELNDLGDWRLKVSVGVALSQSCGQEHARHHWGSLEGRAVFCGE